MQHLRLRHGRHAPVPGRGPRPTTPGDTDPQRGASPRRGASAGAVAGLVAAALALGVAEVVAAIGRTVSPVISVGNRVVDHVPVAVKTFAIERFGTHDKTALLAGTMVGLGLFAAAVGVLAQRRRWWGWIGVAIFAVLGVAAALADAGAGVGRIWPTVLGALSAGVALDVLLHRPAVAQAGRRRFLIGLSATAAAAALSASAGRAVRSANGVGARRAALRLGRPVSPATDAPGIPVGLVPGGLVPGGMDAADPVDGLTPLITPNADFYRIDTALSVPQVDPDAWRLRINGLVDRELSFSLAQLLDRPLVERVLTLVCVSNEVGGTLAGTATWLGVPLAELLREAGVQPDADQLVSRSIDGYSAGTPMAAVLDGRDALVALAMNGEPLPTAHGFPARLIVPGFYGYVSATKWVTELVATRFSDFDAYWVPRGYAQQAPVKTLSRIDTPKGLARVAVGQVPVAGMAWATHRGIRAVEVQIDDGPWEPATLSDAGNDDTWRQWRFSWAATAGRHTIRCRAIDGAGVLQEEQRREPLPDGATGWHQIVVMAA